MISRNGTDYVLRRGPVPCEVRRGCQKGHWKNNPDLTSRQERLIDLFWDVRASFGKCLSKAQRRDGWLMRLLGRMGRSYDTAVRNEERFALQTIATLAQTRGMIDE